MSASKIEWTEHTWNPIVGCSKISPGCDNCYAERMACRLAAMGQSAYEAVTWPDYKRWAGKVAWTGNTDPLTRRKPTTYFVCSMGDLFHHEVPEAWLDALFSNVMEHATRHTFLILTKRADRMQRYLSWRCGEGRIPPRNIWIGVTVEDQPRTDERIPLLLKTPAAKRFISIEPMLDEVTLYTPEYKQYVGRDYLTDIRGVSAGRPLIEAGLDWVILGGESGPGARPMHPDWARGVRDQCKAAGVPFLFKRWGDGYRIGKTGCGFPMRATARQAGFSEDAKHGGRLLDGVLHDARPEARP